MINSPSPVKFPPSWKPKIYPCQLYNIKWTLYAFILTSSLRMLHLQVNLPQVLIKPDTPKTVYMLKIFQQAQIQAIHVPI